MASNVTASRRLANSQTGAIREPRAWPQLTGICTTKSGDAAPVTRAPIKTTPAFPRSAMVAYLLVQERECLGVKVASLTGSPKVQLWAHNPSLSRADGIQLSTRTDLDLDIGFRVPATRAHQAGRRCRPVLCVLLPRSQPRSE